MAAAARPARGDAEPDDPDAAARLERRRLHQLSRQRRRRPSSPRRRSPASTSSASSTRSTGSRTCASPWTPWSTTGKICEAAICYTGDLLDPARAKYDLKYYVAMAKELRDAGAHILGLKDMAGLLKPAAAYTLVKTLKEEVGPADPLPHPRHQRHRRRRASSPPSRAGVDAVDAAMDSFSGNTSQPCLGSIVEALRAHRARHRPRHRRDPPALRSTGRRSAPSTPPSRPA